MIDTQVLGWIVLAVTAIAAAYYDVRVLFGKDY